MEDARKKVLIVGSAGYVGSIVRPALQKHYRCRHFDLRPVPNVDSQDMIVANINDAAAVAQAVCGVDAVVYLALGIGSSVASKSTGVGDVEAAFDVNVRGLYRVLRAGLAAGVRRFVSASTLSVYQSLCALPFVEESLPPDAWEPYGLSKRVGEFLCQAASQFCPEAIITIPRLNQPRNEADFPSARFDPALPRNSCALGPQDLGNLFLACLRHDQPGCSIFHASGDLIGQRMSNELAGKTIGWQPANE